MGLIRTLFATVLLLHLVGCEKKPDQGFLNVAAPGEGSYEIYRIANESPLQFVSEQSGRFNEDVALAPGSYLVLADCSSESVIIYPQSRETLVAHRLKFAAPHAPSQEDSFSIQCSRSDKTKSRQHLTSRYELTVIHGKRDLLVGMVPMHIDFTAMEDPGRPKELSYRLSALQVAKVEGKEDASYFISPVDELIAATKYQRFGHWEFLLPGRYIIEVNGTRMQVDLAAEEERIVKPALLRVATSQEIDLDQPARIKGSPWLVEINTGHWLNFNETYPVLPGIANISISGSTQSVDVTLEEGAEIELKARSITVDSACPTHNQACLGNRSVSLYLPDEPYPFIESVSDIPILFIDQGLPVLLVVEGSRDITLEIPANVRDRTLHLGYAKLIPTPQHRPGQATDLVRVDSLGTPFAGHTLDVNLEKPTLMPLVVGNYQLAHYISNLTVEGDRRNQMRTFTIEPGRTVELEFPVFFSEKKWNAYKKKHPAPDPKASEVGTYRHAPRVRAL